MRAHGSGVVVAVLVLLLVACDDSATPPTLAAGTTAPTTTAAATTSTTTSTSTTTTAAQTTTQAADARLAEIERMVHEAHVGRLQAMHDKDPGAVLPWVASQKMYDDAVEGMEVFVFLEYPTLANTQLSTEEVLLDRADCIVTRTAIDAEGVIQGADEARAFVMVWWPDESGVLRAARYWGAQTPRQVWMEDCDVTPRGVTP